MFSQKTNGSNVRVIAWEHAQNTLKVVFFSKMFFFELVTILSFLPLCVRKTNVDRKTVNGIVKCGRKEHRAVARKRRDMQE